MAHKLIEVEDHIFGYILQLAATGSERHQQLIQFLDHNRGLTPEQFVDIQHDYEVDSGLTSAGVEPGRRIVIGTIQAMSAKIDQYGPYTWVRLLTPNGYTIEFRKPSQADDWHPYAVVQVSLTVVPHSPTTAIGRDPRRVIPGKTKEAMARRESNPLFLQEVADILNEG